MKAQLIDVMGNDLSVVNAARVSFDKESNWENAEYGHPDFEKPNYLSDRDTKLIKFLASHGHWTPFAHTHVSMRMKAPVPIRTQCFKHKQGFVENEESRRYIKSTPELFVPKEFREAPKNAKQGSAGTHSHDLLWKDIYRQTCNEAIEMYEQMIEDGVAPEQARLILPQGVQVQWVWSGSIAAFARFVRQRKDAHAQKEIQELAEMVALQIEPYFPVSWRALTNE